MELHSFCFETDSEIIWQSSDDKAIANGGLVSMLSSSAFKFSSCLSGELEEDAGTKFPYLQNGTFAGDSLFTFSFTSFRFGPTKYPSAR